MSAVAEVQSIPVESTDAAFSVAPGDAGSKSQFLGCHVPDTGVGQFVLCLLNAFGQLAATGAFGSEFAEELFGLFCRGHFCPPRNRRSCRVVWCKVFAAPATGLEQLSFAALRVIKAVSFECQSWVLGEL